MLFYLATKMVIQFIYRTYYPWKTSVVQFGDQKCSQLGTRLSELRLETKCLTSFPSSGNTWLRYLLEGATGIFTGSFYSDVQLTNSGKTIFYSCDQKRWEKNIILAQDCPSFWNSDSGGFYGEIFPWNSGRTCLVKSHGGFLKGHPNNLTIDHLLKCNRKGVLLIR